MGIGMGIGSFVDGFTRGYGIKQQNEDREEARADRADERQWRDEQRGWAREDRTFQASERQRAVDQRENIQDITAEASAEFDALVAAGERNADDFAEFWKTEALPKMNRELLLQGDVEGAKKLMEWGESEAMIKGGRLFAQSMFLAQTGDHAGALDKVIEAGKLRGYIDGDFDIDEKEPIMAEDGTLLGYRVTIRDGDGTETVQDVAIDDIPMVISTFANPAAAWESQQAAAANTKKRAEDLEDYEAKKEIDARHGPDTALKDRTTAVKTLRELYDGELKSGGADALPPFDSLPRDEQERLILEEIAFATGAQSAAPPAQRLIVDGSSGRPVVPTPDPSAVETAPGIGSVPRPQQGSSPAARAGAEFGSGAPKPPAASNAVVNGAVDPGLAAPPSHAQLVDQAAQQMVEGKSPQEIARTLQAVGVDRSQWPAELVRVLGTAPAQ